MMDRDGYTVFGMDARVTAWAKAAARAAERVIADPDLHAQNMRHGDTWFVGVDVLPNGSDGAVDGVPLDGPWDVPSMPLHPAQVSVIYPGYPQPDPDQSAANHRYRVDRCAAHVDGLLPEGPERRRFARELHAYILGLPLDDSTEAPTVIWPGSHRIMRAALREVIGSGPAGYVDVTDAYHAARRAVFATCDPVPIRATLGQSFVIDRFALHGTAPWTGPSGPPRKIAFFRPQYDTTADWFA
ncbi:hypothetical protein [uncultured Tateyamaria sp.]|uniref:hypothetical protein n=1 Tax=uncultured Tateyamaria sp. TaxID=455651 RepID=UPI002604574E|nr:hypothetical protein [uncultured Tateyamaria sp.]